MQLAKKHISVIINGLTHELDLDVFETILAEVSGILNRRPITPISSDPTDPQVLSPANFLYPYVVSPTSMSILPPTPSGAQVRSSWQQVRNVIEHFWSRWQKEYLSELQKRSKWTSSTTNPRVGQVVILADELQPREMWRLAVVTELLSDDVNHIRRVKVRLASGNVLERHVCKLIQLELDE